MHAPLLLVAALLAQPGYYTPEEAQGLFAQANAAYARGDAAEAAEGYQRLLDRGFGGPDVLYNLGTAHLARGDLGRAVLFLERARAEGGGAEDVEAQLALARGRQLDKVVGALAEEPFVQRVVRATDAAAVAGVLLVALWAALVLWLVRRRLGATGRLVTALASALLLTAALPAAALLGAHVWAEGAVREAVVLAPALSARELPQPAARVAFEVHAGLKVRLLAEAGRYVRLRLPNGLEGWAEREGVEPL